MKTSKAVPQINVTPLIDVLLVLLIIFMVISPVKPHKYDTKLPEKTEQPHPDSDLTLVVSISRDAGFKVNQTKVASIAALNTLLHESLDGRPEDRKTVFIKGAPNLNYGEVAQVIDAVKESGATPIGLQLEALE